MKGKLELSHWSISRLKTLNTSSLWSKGLSFYQWLRKFCSMHTGSIHNQWYWSRVLVELFTTQITTFHCILCFCSAAVSSSYLPRVFWCCLWTLRKATILPSCHAGNSILQIWNQLLYENIKCFPNLCNILVLFTEESSSQINHQAAVHSCQRHLISINYCFGSDQQTL